jgi:hypothetical protein
MDSVDTLGFFGELVLLTILLAALRSLYYVLMEIVYHLKKMEYYLEKLFIVGGYIYRDMVEARKREELGEEDVIDLPSPSSADPLRVQRTSQRSRLRG